MISIDPILIIYIQYMVGWLFACLHAAYTYIRELEVHTFAFEHAVKPGFESRPSSKTVILVLRLQCDSSMCVPSFG